MSRSLFSLDPPLDRPLAVGRCVCSRQGVLASDSIDVASTYSSSERATRLRNVLTVMGCDVKAYWIGTLAGDMSLALVISCSIVIVAFVCSAAVPDKLSPWSDARLFALLPLSAFQLCRLG